MKLFSPPSGKFGFSSSATQWGIQATICALSRSCQNGSATDQWAAYTDRRFRVAVASVTCVDSASDDDSPRSVYVNFSW